MALLLEQYSEKKQKAIIKIASGVGFKQVAKECGVAVNTVYCWRQDPIFIDAISELAAMNIEETISSLSPNYKQIIERAIEMAFDDNTPADLQLKALTFAATKLEKALNFRDNREVRELNRLLKGLPEDADLLNRAREKITGSKISNQEQEDDSTTSE